MAASMHIEDTIATIQIDNPPVNGLSLHLRQALSEKLAEAERNPEIRAVVLIGSDKAFCGGADIREFGTDRSQTKPRLRDIIDQLDQSTKPIVAAIGGFALGGGLELALGCHYRIALQGARLGLPEISLGILAAGGGIQRLPRIIPVEKAVDFILKGVPVPLSEALQLGLVDEIVERDLVLAARTFAKGLLHAGKGVRRIRDMVPRMADPKGYFARKRSELAKSSRGRIAPLANLDCLEVSVTRPFDEGQDYSTATFLKLVAGAESRALRHSFFAEREAAKVPDLPADTTLRPIARAAVIGAGTMGSGIAMCFANAGIPVMVIDTKQDALERSLAGITKNYAATVAKGRLSQAEMQHRLSLVTTGLHLSEVSSADIIVEAVFEDMEIKKLVFAQLDKVAKPGAILATNTSTLDVNEIGSATSRPRDVIGAHFFSPANVMRLLEVIRGKESAPDVIATTMALGKKLGKVAVLAGVCDGFIGNRILEKYRVQTMILVDLGASPQQIDRALVSWGLAMGPFAMGDLAGNDVSWLVRKHRAKIGRNYTPNPLADQLCEMGRFGQKTGKGWYRYEGGSRTPLVDPEVEAMIDAHRASLGIKPRVVTDDEIIERCIFAMANEGARIVEEGIALRSSDVDAVYLNGYGFPAHRGGPMFFADEFGLQQVAGRIRDWMSAYGGSSWVPAELLLDLAAKGGRFNGSY